MSLYQKTKTIKRNNSNELLALRELAIRTPVSNEKQKQFFNKQFAMAKAGHDGEVKVDRILERIPFPMLHTIIPDFHTQSKFGTFFQMDTLIITNRYILLLEIKNIRGQIEFYENPDQIIRTYEGVTEKLDCPIHQLNRNKKALENIVFTVTQKLPIYSAIVFCHSSAHISNYPKTAKILYKNQVDFYIEQLNSLPEKCNKDEYLHLVKTVNTINRNFKRIPLAVRYSIDVLALRQGIFCHSCEQIMVPAEKSTAYHCKNCDHIDKEVLSKTITSLFYILHNDLKRSDIERYLDIRTKHRVTKALAQLRCSKKGKARATRYSLPKT